MKPSHYNYKVEISPLNIYINMRQTIKQKIKLIDMNYLSKRLSIIKNLQHITNKLKYRRQTFFLAMSYLDYILSLEHESNEMKPEILALTCLVLAGKL